MYRYDFACEIGGWPKPAKNLLTALAQGDCDSVRGLTDYFMDKHRAKFVYTTHDDPTTHVLFPTEQDATMFLLKWA